MHFGFPAAVGAVRVQLQRVGVAGVGALRERVHGGTEGHAQGEGEREEVLLVAEAKGDVVDVFSHVVREELEGRVLGHQSCGPIVVWL